MNLKKRIFFLLCALVTFTTSATTSELDGQIKVYKQKRDHAKLKAEIAGRDADRLMTLDWLGYRQSLERQEYFQKEMKAYDAKISELEKQKMKALQEGVE